MFEEIETDLLIIGSGVAGAYGALLASSMGARVMLVTKTELVSGSTQWAQGGIAFPDGRDDIPSHLEDTLRAGRGLSDPTVTREILGESLEHLALLKELGMDFDPELALEGGHSRPRVKHIGGDRSGLFLLKFLHSKLIGRITSLERHFVVGLRAAEDESVMGAWAFGPNQELIKITAASVVLATGGSGQLFSVTTNPPEATGDGIVLALKAGATIRNIELAQFHPTALMDGSLISEACRGEGAILLNKNGERFMTRYDPLGELAPRDVVARAVINEERSSGGVFLDLRPVGDLANSFPTVFASCVDLGLNPLSSPVPISPAAHYQMGGVSTDSHGRTTVAGLFAAGEVASTGLHGANRLASNSLLEGLVMGARAARTALKELEVPGHCDDAPPFVGGLDLYLRPQIQQIMTSCASVLRNGVEIQDGRRRLNLFESFETSLPSEVETLNLLEVGKLVLSGALARQESRGAHYREDFDHLSSIAFHVDQTKDSISLVPFGI